MSTLTAPAKLNLFLVVGDTRPDGYHTVTTVLVAVDGGDTVTVEPAERLSLRCDPDVGVAPEQNLAWRAARAMGEAFGREPAFAISVDKRIPAGAGLGGGSSDAAAVIAAIAGAWDVDRSDLALQTVARSLGADVPFFLRGGCGVYAGRGDVPRRTLPVPPGFFAIARPDATVATADAYAAFDAGARQARPSVRAVTDAICLQDAVSLGASLYNNMTSASTGLAPAVGEVLAFMGSTDGCLGPAMAGSGSAVFGLFADLAGAEAAASAAARKGWWSLAARPVAGGTLDEVMGVASDADQGRRGRSGRRRR
jgi:4-diphosphocytidyl-2-C-methyl-D-erythritol kinase